MRTTTIYSTIRTAFGCTFAVAIAGIVAGRAFLRESYLQGVWCWPGTKRPDQRPSDQRCHDVRLSHRLCRGFMPGRSMAMQPVLATRPIADQRAG